MKITFFIGGLGSGGAEHVVTELANYFVANNHSVTILTWSNSIPHYELDKRTSVCPCRKTQSRNILIRNISSYIGLRKFVNNSNTDIYIAFLPVTILLLLSLRRTIHVPVIITVRNYPPTEYNGVIKRCLGKYLLKKADGIIYQTNEQKQCFIYLEKIPSIVIPNAVNIPNETIENFKWKRTGRIIAVGRLHPQKNYSFMIDIMSKILRDYPEYKLCIYGEGREKDILQKQILDNHMQKQIYLCGITKDISAELQSAELFIMTSDYEGISNALLEAMATGLPVIATDSLGGGARMLIKNGENGFLISRRNAKAFEEAIRLCLSDSNMCMKISEYAKRVNFDYNSNAIYKKWETFIREISVRSQK